MGKLTCVTDFEFNVDFIEKIKAALDSMCENRESESLTMGKKDGECNTYELCFNYKGYKANINLSVKEIYEFCEDPNHLSYDIGKLINRKINEHLAKNL